MHEKEHDTNLFHEKYIHKAAHCGECNQEIIKRDFFMLIAQN